MKIKNERDFWCGLMCLAAGSAFAWSASRHAFGSALDPGPGAVPFVLGLVLALLGALVLFKSLVIETEGGEPIGPIAWRALLAVVAALLLFAFALPRFGWWAAPLLAIALLA